MARIPLPDSTADPIVLTEWSRKTSVDDARLKDTSFKDNASAQLLANDLRNRVDISQGYEGLEISSTSFVGRVNVGPLCIAIEPKLNSMPLATLLRYAYGLRDLSIFDNTRTPTTIHGLHDLLIAMLADEIEELLHRGLARHYVSTSQKLQSPKGTILIDALVRQGGITEARLPCRYFERRVNWKLNRILRSGLLMAMRMTEDRQLRRRVRRLANMFDDVEPIELLAASDIEQVHRSLTRLTAANEPALKIIALLKGMHGVAFQPSGKSIRTPGFLFDMNYFFQRLLLRFLCENLTAGRIKGEHAIRNVFAYVPDANPRGQPAPTPRPDYALFSDRKLIGFLDAKYRDVWEKGFSSNWLYQLSIYALASPSCISVMLYATTSPGAREERIQIRQPVPWTSKDAAIVILRPVLLQKVAELVHPGRSRYFTAERRQFANDLVILGSRAPTVIAAQGLGQAA